MPSAREDFYRVLREAVDDIQRRGFTSTEHLASWIARLKQAAASALVPESVLIDQLTRHLGTIFRREVDHGGLLKSNPGLPRYTIERVTPRLRRELDRRVFTSANLIKLNRQEAVETTMRRFAGWSSSIPPGGTQAGGSAAAESREISKALKSLPFRERRVAIDQGAKFTATLNQLVAEDAGALAAEWHSRWRVKNYDYREDHKERDEVIYPIRDSWAHQKGYIKVGPDGWYDSITKPGEEVFCRCSARYIYSLGALPEDLLTAKGKEAVAEARLNKVR